MSLHKTYQVRCDGVSLAARLNVTGVSFRDHSSHGPAAVTSVRARRAAISDGWTRQTRKMLIAGGVDTSLMKFDLCPFCAGTIGTL